MDSFFNGLWRGSECREELEMHVQAYFDELDGVVKDGIELTVNGKNEYFIHRHRTP